jgi:hypothetical protein
LTLGAFIGLMQPLTTKNQTNQMIIFLWCASSNHYEQMQDFKHKRRDYLLVLADDPIQALETSMPPSSIAPTCAQPPTISSHLLLSHGPPCCSLDCATTSTWPSLSSPSSATTTTAKTTMSRPPPWPPH